MTEASMDLDFKESKMSHNVRNNNEEKLVSPPCL